jgi:hypothetical protein
LIEYGSGSLDYITHNYRESVVTAVLSPLSIFENNVYLVKGTRENNGIVFKDEDRLANGVDYRLNYESGALKFLSSYTPEDIIKETYFVEGESVVGDKAEKRILDSSRLLRLEKYPIQQNSVTITGIASQGGQQIFLLEGEDYTVSYSTGLVTFIKDSAIGSVLVEYTPLSLYSCEISPTESDPENYNILVEREPLELMDGTSFKFKIQNPNVSVKEQDPVDTSKETFLSELTPKSFKSIYLINDQGKAVSSYDIAGLSYNNSTKEVILKQNAQKDKVRPTNVSMVMASYSYEDYRLPYSPVIPNDMIIPAGVQNFTVEGADRTAEFLPGSIIRLDDGINGNFFFFGVKNSEYNGFNTIVSLDSTVPQNITNPLCYISDSILDFQDFSGSFQAVGAKSNTVTLSGIHDSFRIKQVLKMKGYLLHYITDVRYTENSTILEIFPPASEYVSGSSSLKFSKVPVYTQGDQAVFTINPFRGDLRHPAFTIGYKTPSLGSASATVDSSKLTLKETLFADNSLISQDISFADFPTLRSLESKINTDSSLNTKYSIEIHAGNANPVEDWKTTNLIGEADQPLSYTAGISPEVLLNNKKLPFTEGGKTYSYSFVNGVIVLSQPLIKGDKVIATYLGSNLYKSQIGDVTAVSCKYFTTLKKGATVKITTEYLNPDQFYIETIREDDYLTNVYFKELEQMVSQKSGQVSSGVEGTSDTEETNAQGGLENNLYRLREQTIRKVLFKKIYEYYNNRLLTFGKEAENIDGLKLGNSENRSSGVTNNILKETDLTNALSNDFSIIYTKENKTTTPALQNRFLQEIPNYSQAHFKNVNNRGSVKSGTEEFPDLYSGWDLYLRVNDQIRMSGREDYYTITSISNDGTTLSLDREITEIEEEDYDYFIKFQSPPAYVFWGDYLFLGAEAVTQEYVSGTKALAFGTFRKFKIRANSYLRVIITLSDNSNVTVSVKSLATMRSISSVVEWLQDSEDLAKYFKISQEYGYGIKGLRDTIVFRGHTKTSGALKSVKSFKFPSASDAPIAKNLGFPIDINFLPYIVEDSASTKIRKEKSDNTYLSDYLGYVKGIYAKMTRVTNSITYRTEILARANTLKNSTPETLPRLQEAISQIDLIRIETDASAQITDSYIQAGVAKSNYTNFIEKIQTSDTRNQSFISTINSSYDTFILSVSKKTLNRSQAQQTLKQSLLNTGSAQIDLMTQDTLPQDDPRIFYGDQSEEFSYSFDNTVYNIFPTYNPSTVKGPQVDGRGLKLAGQWSSSESSTGALSLSKTPNNLYTYYYKVTDLGIYITVEGLASGNFSFLYSSYPLVRDLVQAINNGTLNSVTAEVLNNLGEFSSVGLQNAGNNTPRGIEFSYNQTVNTQVFLYSPGPSSKVTMSPLIEIVSDYPQDAIVVLESFLVLVADNDVYGILFTEFPTVGSLLAKINTFPRFTATSMYDNNFYYGALVHIDYVTFNGLPKVLYAGMKGDLWYYQISDQLINQKTAELLSRRGEIDQVNTFIDSRVGQIKQSVLSENLVSNWNQWLNLRMNKEYGCEYKEKSLLEQIAKSRLESQKISELTSG